MNIVRADNDHHFLIIQHIAKYTWPETFENILTPDQITYMLDMMYSDKSLAEQTKNNHKFILAIEDGTYLGFASYELNYQNTQTTKVHKLYILPKWQGKGVGKFLLDDIMNAAREAGNTALTLNVNRHNPSVNFYQKQGWTIVKEEDNDIGNGYFMNDYVMNITL